MNPRAPRRVALVLIDLLLLCLRLIPPISPFRAKTGDRDGGRGGYGGDRYGDKKMGPGGDFNPEFQRVRRQLRTPDCSFVDLEWGSGARAVTRFRPWFCAWEPISNMQQCLALSSVELGRHGRRFRYSCKGLDLLSCAPFPPTAASRCIYHGRVALHPRQGKACLGCILHRRDCVGYLHVCAMFLGSSTRWPLSMVPPEVLGGCGLASDMGSCWRPKPQRRQLGRLLRIRRANPTGH